MSETPGTGTGRLAYVTKSGRVLTEAELDALAAEAERGYDPGQATRAYVDPLPDDGKITYSVPEAAKLLGISPASAYEAVHRGELTVVKIGRRMLVPKVALRRLLEGKEPS